MKNYLQGGWTVFKNYIIVDIIFLVFLYPILSFGKESVVIWIAVYSFVMFLLLLAIMYSDFHRLAVKEKKPQYDLNPLPYKGLIYGIFGIIPLGFLGLLYPILAFSDIVLERLKHLVFNCLLGPLYWVIYLGNEATWSYICAILLIPVITGISYFGGYKGIYLNKKNKPGALINKNSNGSAKR